MPDKTEKNNCKEFENSLPMSRDKFKKLFDYLDNELDDKGCEDTNRLTRSLPMKVQR